MATILEIIQGVADELALPRPSSVTATDASTRQLLALANREGLDLVKAHTWQFLDKEYVIEFSAPATVTGTTAVGSRVVTGVSDTTGFVAGTYAVSGTGVKPSCRVASVDSSTQFTMTEAATADGTDVTLTIAKDTFDLPSDFDRFVELTFWDRGYKWALIGPRSPQFDQWERSGIVSLGPRRRWRQIGNKFRIWPVPDANTETSATLVFEYITKNWVTKADSTTASTMTADDDTPIFPDGLVSLGIKWRYLQAKGFDYAAFQAEYRDFRDGEIAQDGGMKTLDLTRRNFPMLISPANVQDGNWPGN